MKNFISQMNNETLELLQRLQLINIPAGILGGRKREVLFLLMKLFKEQ